MGNSTESELNSSFSKTNCFIRYLQEVVWGFCLHLLGKRCSPLTASSPSCVTEEIQHGHYWQSQSWLDITKMSLREVQPQTGQDQKLGFKHRRPVRESCLKCWAVGNTGAWWRAIAGFQEAKNWSCPQGPATGTSWTPGCRIKTKTSPWGLPVRESA